ncbi:MAG: nucleotidyltransferase domain-containing protein [Deltaproteobacteria bacterium]|nr:nucleotidyltransferase domain-containing protein [Deltaproteobacteria bacterium]
MKKYATKLKAKRYPFSAVYLFGSYTKGKANRWSDIDVAIISDKLKKNWNKNEDILWKYTIGIDSRIEPIGFTVKDFQDDSNPIVYEIKRTGIKIV